VAIGVSKMFDFRAHGTASMLDFFRAMDHIRREDTKRAAEMKERQLEDLCEAHPLSDRHKRLLMEACSFVRYSSAAYTGFGLDLLRKKVRETQSIIQAFSSSLTC